MASKSGAQLRGSAFYANSRLRELPVSIHQEIDDYKNYHRNAEQPAEEIFAQDNSPSREDSKKQCVPVSGSFPQAY
jgi:hypothetical protein